MSETEAHEGAPQRPSELPAAPAGAIGQPVSTPAGGPVPAPTDAGPAGGAPKAPAAPPPVTLKPDRLAFMAALVGPQAVLLGALLVAFLVAVALVDLPDVPHKPLIVLTVVAGAALLIGVNYALAQVVFRKERYEFLPSRLVAHTGTLFSDTTTELEVRNITHVKRRLPWIRHMLFDVGDVYIESAGQADSQLVLHSVKHPVAVYEQVQAHMRENGFSLRGGALHHQESPDLVGSILQCIGSGMGGLFTLLYIGAYVGQKLPLQVVLAGAALCALLLLVGVVLHFLDLRRRVYRVFDDVVLYEEGFLTRDDALIPLENLADSNTHQTFFDRLLGLSAVQLSCQGTGSEISFKILRRGRELEAAIDRLVAGVAAQKAAEKEAKRLAALEAERAAAAAAAGAAALDPSLSPSARLAPPPTMLDGKAWTGHFKPHLPRALAPFGLGALLLFPLMPLWVLLLLRRWVETNFVSYEVRQGSVKSRFKFFSTLEREFTYDKITGVVELENPFDRSMGTMTLRLWSIGSGEPLDLLHVPREVIDLDAFRYQCGVDGGDVLHEVPSRFNLERFVRGNLQVPVVVALLTLALVVGIAFVDPRFVPLALVPLLGAIPAFLYGRAYYQNMLLSFHERTIVARSGLFFRSITRTRYRSVKKIRLRRYPKGDEGDIQVFVAGEQRLLANRQNPDSGVVAVVPYGFTHRYAEGMRVKEQALDQLVEDGPKPAEVQAIAAGQVPPAPPPRLVSKPDVGNSVLMTVVMSVVTVVGIVFLPLTLPWTLMQVRAREFRLEASRVVRRWGVIYRYQSSVFFSRMDSLRRDQGMVNKIFKNATVTILTAGSSRPDLVLEDMPNADAIYAELKAHYKGEGSL